MAKPHIGNCPGNVRKDAKYSVVNGKNGMEIRLIYRMTTGEVQLITTNSHPELVDLVNRVKESHGSRGGAFYINEYHEVLVPVATEGSEYYAAGTYNHYLQFEFDGSTIGPEPPVGTKPGDVWPGPKVGIPYTLTADGCDLKYKLSTGPKRYIEKRLSDDVGKSESRRLAQRLSRYKQGGGRIYVNEARQFFAPVQNGNAWEYIYLGGLDGDSWFDQPSSRRT